LLALFFVALLAVTSAPVNTHLRMHNDNVLALGDAARSVLSAQTYLRAPIGEVLELCDAAFMAVIPAPTYST
jgi:hypothetical protein